MRRSRSTLQFLLRVTIALVVARSAVAQPAGGHVVPGPPSDVPSRPPLPIGNPVSSPAPEWLVWMTFYDSLEYYESKSPGSASRLLSQRAQLSQQTALALRASGQDYRAQLSRIDAETRRSIKARYLPDAVLTFPMRAPPTATDISKRPPDVAAVTTKDGRDLHTALIADGVVSALESRKQDQLQQHRDRLLEIVGADALSKIEELLKKDVAPHVFVITRALPAAPPPGAGDRRPSLQSLISR